MVTKRTKAHLAILSVAMMPIVGIGLYAALVDFRPPMPGDLPSPKLVEMFNKEIDASLARIAEPHSLYKLGPPYRPEAADHARRWFSEVREMVTHCRYGGGGGQNPHAYDLTLESGEVFSDVGASITRCRPGDDTAMRVTFEGGRVTRVTTDGSERERTPEVARERVKLFVDALVQYDERRRPERYYAEPDKLPDPALAWDAL